MKKLLISGSIAYDTIMEFDGEFKDLILPEHISDLNVCFNISKLEKRNGGTAHNIAYSLGLLGLRDQSILLTSVGKDFMIEESLSELIDYKHIYKDNELYTANCTIVTEKKQNQIITFYPGALNVTNPLSISNIPDNQDISYAMLSPNGKIALKFISECKDKEIKTFFDPGQTIGLYDKNDIIRVLNNANYLIVNEYEYSLVKNISGLGDVEILELMDKVIITLGKEGTKMLSKTENIQIPAIKLENVVDPTGAGDAFRSGLLYGLINDLSRELSIKYGNVVASFVVESNGGMNHKFSLSDVEDRLKNL